MGQVIRQSNLLAAEDWRVVHKAFQQVNFTAYDFDSIRASMVDYIRFNFPEDFNDWIESSEFVALIDLLAYLGQSLAFRMDINTRENFLDTAERKDSVLKLARMLSYVPQRNFPAFGLLKIEQVQTSEPIFDSETRNLSNVPINWNDAVNTDWFEQFILVMNAAFNPNNRFGQPVKKGTINSVPTELYEFNSLPGLQVVFPFTATISSDTFDFEVFNVNFVDNGVISELSPDPFNSFGILFRDDGTGNSSPNTGFFVPFKQGSLSFKDFNYTTPLENRVTDINLTNVNETDVWVQEIDSDGKIVNEWERVPTVSPSSNIIFNAIDKVQRNIYTVLTREDDQISIRYADGRFGNIPNGTFRVWNRVSNGLAYQIRPQEISSFSLSFSYTNLQNKEYQMTLTYSLEEAVSNSSPTESIDSVKERAPQVFSTQDRMVNGEDYNVFPLQRSTQAAKVKAINRTFSGHSRFIDINDPTGTIQNSNVFSDDGLIYKELNTKLDTLSIPTSLTFRQIIANHITTAIQSIPLRNFRYSLDEPGIPASEKKFIQTNFALTGTSRVFWQTATELTNSVTGFFEQNSLTVSVGTGQSDPFSYITKDALINLVLATNTADDGIFVKIITLTGAGDGLNADDTGKITIDERIGDNIFIIKQVIPSFSTTFTEAEIVLIEEQLQLQNTFGLGFDFKTKEWYIIVGQDMAATTTTFSFVNAKNKTGANLDASWFVRVEFASSEWRFFTRGIDYIWESVKDVRFFFSSNYKAVDLETGNTVQDTISVIKSNLDLDLNLPYDEDLLWQIDSAFIFADGFIEPRRVKITMLDADDDGTPDNPLLFDQVVSSTPDTLYWEKFTSDDGYERKKPITILPAFETTQSLLLPLLTVDGDLGFATDTLTFHKFDKEFGTTVDVSTSHEFNLNGRRALFFQWKHFASRNNRIDPSITNLIDIFVLTTQYNLDFRTWIKTNGAEVQKPLPPSTESLKNTFIELEQFKMISDQMIWRPTKYLVLFGSQAKTELQATFKVVKVFGITLSDNEIKSRIISAIDEFFDLNNWDFGETFYFTELAAFIHQRLTNIIGSIVLVPLNESSKFGNLFQVKVEPDEIVISGARVADIQIVDNLTESDLRVGS